MAATQEESLPYKYVSIEGTVASIAPATAEELSAMAIRYLGQEMGEQYAQSNSIEGQVTVTITPTRWLAVDYGKAS